MRRPDRRGERVELEPMLHVERLVGRRPARARERGAGGLDGRGGAGAGAGFDEGEGFAGEAERLGVVGRVRNRTDGAVEIVARARDSS